MGLTEKISRLYKTTEGDVQKARRRLAIVGIDVSQEVILANWRRRVDHPSWGGSRPKLNGSCYAERQQEDERIILGAYHRYSGDPALAARSLPYSRHKISGVWRHAGLAVGKRAYAKREQ